MQSLVNPSRAPGGPRHDYERRLSKLYVRNLRLTNERNTTALCGELLCRGSTADYDGTVTYKVSVSAQAADINTGGSVDWSKPWLEQYKATLC